MFLEKSLSLI